MQLMIQPETSRQSRVPSAAGLQQMDLGKEKREREEREGRKNGRKEGWGAKRRRRRGLECGGGTDWRSRMFKQCV